MSFSDELKEYLLSQGASDAGFFKCDDGPFPCGVSVVVRLSPAIVGEIDGEPTYTYFNHYRTVNAYIYRLTGVFRSPLRRASTKTAGIIRADTLTRRAPALPVSAQ